MGLGPTSTHARPCCCLAQAGEAGCFDEDADIASEELSLGRRRLTEAASYSPSYSYAVAEADEMLILTCSYYEWFKCPP